MPHNTALIATVAAAFGIALLFGVVAARLKLPPIVGYLLAGIVVGPFSPGYVADSRIAAQAADVGVVLLMFGVGLHFSLRDLMDVRRIVGPGALAQIVITGSVGTILGRGWGLEWGGALVVGIALSVASTVVVLKGLEASDRLDSRDGRLAVGWLVVEDLAMIAVLVLLPAIAPALGGAAAAGTDASTTLVLGGIAIALGKVIAFGTLMFVVGRRAVPWLLQHVATLGSRELFTLTVLATALGVGALAAEVFGVSFALGAFFAGAVVSESELSQRAAADALPLQDAFAVLFFVSVGMLFDPRVLVEHPGKVVAILAVILGCKLVVSYVLLRALGQTPRTALTLGGSLAQIGEFSFIVTGLGASLQLIARETQALVVAGALISISVNQPFSAVLQRALNRKRAGQEGEGAEPRGVAHLNSFDFGALSDHVILVGYGRVGSTITEALERAGVPHVVIEEQERIVMGLRRRGQRSIHGDATRVDVLQRAGVTTARLIVVTAPEPIRARRIVALARDAGPHIAVAVRTHSAAEQAYFESTLDVPGAPGRAIYAEREVAFSLAHYTLLTIGHSDDEADAVIGSLRKRQTGPTETFAAMHTRESEARASQ